MPTRTVTEETITFIEFFYPGSLFSESSDRQVKNRDKPKRIPKNAYSYRFYDKVKITIEGEDAWTKDEVFWRKAKNFSGQHFIDGEKFTLVQLKKKYGKDDNYAILISNMKCNRWKHVVKCKTGNWQPFEKGDKIV